ncbi:DUF1934 family protein [Facklamia sp. DSM 111018]|uniref:DUF1934 family protein n=1 Tax=Facklamia lactis TaxID=2749967 RepID=A0ABS0LUI1_9LACT|nr:DUF1934 family protein [Facklamia lactis]MBG9981404.1 DUF1934 family protein [Facklamia lactis]MBG9987120.1 DUF1934 family protein [Facklamia lactis]
MYRKKVNLNVDQSIRYMNEEEHNTWQHRSHADLVVLSTYSRIQYFDKDGLEITIKWFRDTIKNQYKVEIHQPQYSLSFKEGDITYTSYQTPQGVWELKVYTKGLDVCEEDSYQIIHIQYQIYLQDKQIGEYDFQLKYWD